LNDKERKIFLPWYPFSGGWEPEILTILSFIKIPPNLPFPKGGFIPLFGKEGRGEIL
jgi:hypothetical protein